MVNCRTILIIKINHYSTIYDRLKSSGLITPSYEVYDGIDAVLNCPITRSTFSYTPGVLISSLVLLHDLTSDPYYITEASYLAAHALNYFVSDHGSFKEPACDQPGVCNTDPPTFGFSLFRGLSQLYRVSSDKSLKDGIKLYIQKSIMDIVPHCSADFNCVRRLPAGTKLALKDGSNPRDQIQFVEYVTSLAVVLGLGDEGFVATSTVDTISRTEEGTPTHTTSGAHATGHVSLFVFMFIFISFISFIF
jgi:hypothetical protein